MLLKLLPVSLMLTRRRQRLSAGDRKRPPLPHPRYRSHSLATEACCLSRLSKWKKKGANENFELVYRETWEMDLVEINRMVWDPTRNLMSLWRGLMSLCMV